MKSASLVEENRAKPTDARMDLSLGERGQSWSGEQDVCGDSLATNASRTGTPTRQNVVPSTILLVEDDAATSARQGPLGVRSIKTAEVCVRLHRVIGSRPQLVGERTYRSGSLSQIAGRAGKALLALELLDAIEDELDAVLAVAGPSYGENQYFLRSLFERGIPCAVQLRPSARLRAAGGQVVAADLLAMAKRWTAFELMPPEATKAVPYAGCDLGLVQVPGGRELRLLAAQAGRIGGVHRGTLLVLSSLVDAPLEPLVVAAAWSLWIRRLARVEARMEAPSRGVRASLAPPMRANIALTLRQDARDPVPVPTFASPRRPRLFKVPSPRVVELFAGAGGMGLGFLLAGRYRILASAEVHPVYVETLRMNHRAFGSRSEDHARRVPAQVEPLDLRSEQARAQLDAVVRAARGVDIVIGGPPCQGFSNANRNSWDSENPHNRLVAEFVRYVERLKPRAFLMENVQGILWTSHAGSDAVAVVDHVAARLKRAGYLVFPKLLDAAWYGVPQFRSRFFLLGFRDDLGLRANAFREWGPFPRPTHGPNAASPYVSVRQALNDLPAIGNGQRDDAAYTEPHAEALEANPFLAAMRSDAVPGVLHDHVTSRHADYVLERYRAIPAGGNWEDIKDQLTNYAAVERTHSNIYRRLSWDAPSITIGHYRKSMLVHPEQHRGLSMREAARLQSFPDWYRFAGHPDGRTSGLMHQQQQLANAVCPLVTKALAEFLLQL